jgi:hypothetical protein
LLCQERTARQGKRKCVKILIAAAFVIASAAFALLSPITARSASPATTSVAPTPLPSPDRLLFLIRRQFRSHRPPPAYVTYTLVRKQTLDDGYPDLVNSYTYHIWCRTYDRAALGRRVYRGSARGTLEFLRPSFNEPWDPGPPTADLFEPAPAHPHSDPRTFVPTPEPTGSLPPTIAVVTAMGEFDYRITNIVREGSVLHLSLLARRDPDRNRIRELYVDAKTLELQQIVATDKLFEEGDNGNHVYPMLFTVTLGWMDNMPLVTHIHGTPTYQADAEYLGKDATVDYDFNDIEFPNSLPAWYFDPRSYAGHTDDMPK